VGAAGSRRVGEHLPELSRDRPQGFQRHPQFRPRGLAQIAQEQKAIHPRPQARRPSARATAGCHPARGGSRQSRLRMRRRIRIAHSTCPKIPARARRFDSIRVAAVVMAARPTGREVESDTSAVGRGRGTLRGYFGAAAKLARYGPCGGCPRWNVAGAGLPAGPSARNEAVERPLGRLRSCRAREHGIGDGIARLRGLHPLRFREPCM